MKKKANPPSAATAAGTAITNCHFECSSAANKHTRASVEALALAVQANAQAISDIARALNPPSSMAGLIIGAGG